MVGELLMICLVGSGWCLSVRDSVLTIRFGMSLLVMS